MSSTLLITMLLEPHWMIPTPSPMAFKSSTDSWHAVSENTQTAEGYRERGEGLIQKTTHRHMFGAEQCYRMHVILESNGHRKYLRAITL